eukprot:SAG11_NODE_63_length_18904_cov_11.842914_10_plen_210_part_00
MRPSRGAVVPGEVHRKFAENGTLVTWPKLDSGLQTPAPAAVFVPHIFQNWQRGVSDSQFTGSRVTLKNVSVMMQLQMPKTIPTAQNFPYRLRITHGYCKQNTVVSIKSAVGAPEDLPNGIALNQPQPDADIPWLDSNAAFPPAFATVFQKIDDVNYLGLHETELSWPRDRFHILSDSTMTVTPETSIVGTGVADPDKVLFLLGNLLTFR